VATALGQSFHFDADMPIQISICMRRIIMELSAIVKRSGLALSRSENRLVALLPGGASAESPERYEQKMKALAAARAVLEQLPDRQTIQRRSRMEKAAMLKERLKMLRQMIPLLSPSAAKSLKLEMKQIAAQLASLDAGSGGGGGSAIVTREAPAVEKSDSSPGAETAQLAAAPERDKGDSGTLQERHASAPPAKSGLEA
jgi:hypothetical protein